MNGKKAKEQRKEGELVQFQVIITCLKDGRLNVTGFPTNYNMASNIIDGAKKVVIDYFINNAIEGKLDNKGNVQVSPILQQDKRIVLAGH